MKKRTIISVLLAAILLVMLCGCSDDTPKPTMVPNSEDVLHGVTLPESVQLNDEQEKLDKMWDLWQEGRADSPYAELMTYQAEINNGGHEQYFFNVGNTRDLKKEMEALETVLPAKLQSNLQTAYDAYLKLMEDEADEQAEEILDQCDSAFWEDEQEINLILSEYAATINQGR